jgi:hypothetical protein
VSSKDCPNCGNPLDAANCKICGYSTIPAWIRLWHGDDIALTLRDESSNITRELFLTYFRHITTPAGHPVAAYLPSNGAPFIVVTRTEDGWHASAPVSHRNKAVIDGKELNTLSQRINDGSLLEIIAGAYGDVVGKFTFKYR